MIDEEFVAEVRAAMETDPASFAADARSEAEELKTLIADEAFDNPQALTGLEYEFYAISAADEEYGALARVPRHLLEFIGFEKELGLHNAELSTRPLPVNEDGLVAQEAELVAQLRTAGDVLRREDLRLVSDGMWTIPPVGEDAGEYLTASTDVEDLRIATNMSAAPRYHAMANTGDERRPAMDLEAPSVSLAADTVMPESLTTSIQPHFQVPRANDLPTFFAYALRIAGPLTALAANSPLFPPDLYRPADPEDILAAGWDAHRIRVFESVMNAPEIGLEKVRFPRDVPDIETAIDRIAEDPVIVPLPTKSAGRFDDNFGTFRLKTGTYWRWVRPVFDGATRGAANARIEFRPMGAQPTIRDCVAFQAAFVGLLAALPTADHPVIDLDWEVARENFYAAARSGLDADLEWIDASGNRTSDPELLFGDLLAQAAEGLRSYGLSEEAIGRYLGPLRGRVRAGTTPADWKRRQVLSRLTSGETFADAIMNTQREYFSRQESTLLGGDFTDWIEAGTADQAELVV